MDPTKQFRLDGKIALVTGASSGIGKALCTALHGAGASVALCARREERIVALAASLNDSTDAGARAAGFVMDLQDPANISRAFDNICNQLGVPDVIINNAGIAEPATFLKTDIASLERTIATNFIGPWHVCREAATRLIAARQPGSIVNVASVLGLGAAVGYSSYSASKGALLQLTRSLALEFVRHRIRVNAIAPGWFPTEMNQAFFESDAGRQYVEKLPTGRLGVLDELIAPVLLLASDAGSWVNGVVLPVDGGHHVALA